MPAAKQPSTYFKTIQTLHLDYAPVQVTQYESARTGMRVVVVDQKGPKVNGYFALATEIHDDSGAPHTLEHLCFMGSKSYRYKGLLDKLATRAYSTTNAWTATEQTAYTLDTAGWDGFAQILPVYLEHVIVPTLTDAGCYTEVWHVDGSGNDAGVVYSEMQGVQNTQEDLMDLAAKRLMYPEGCGFRYETGGMMDQLRVLTADRIREFHKAMYQPKNLCLVLTGEVDHEHLLSILDDFEETIVDDVPAIDAPFERPWSETQRPPALSKTTIETVMFPEEDESMGEIIVGFFGPDCHDHLMVGALGIILIYLCGSSISVLENTLVEKEQLCSMVYYSTDTRHQMTIWFQLSAVETEKLAHVEQRLIDLLKETAENKLDMDYMHDCIKRWRRQIKLHSENAGSFFASPIIEDHLFGRRDGRDLKEMETIKELDTLEQWDESQWRDFLRKHLVDAHHISILGQPSHELSEKITSDEKARVKAQQDRLGEKGLQDLADKLKKAQDENDKPIPDSLLEKFAIPDAASIHFISTTSARAGTAKQTGEVPKNEIQDIIDKDDDNSPLYFHFEHTTSNFVRIKLDLCTGAVPLEFKPLLSLYMMNFFSTPVMRNGKRIEFEDLVLDLERETVAYGIDSESANPEMMSITLQTEPDNYEGVISWLRTLLFDAVHDKDRLYSALTKILADIPDEKRSGDAMVYAINSMLQYERNSAVRARNTLSKALSLKRLRKQLQSSPETVLSHFSTLCSTLHQPSNFRIFISGNIHHLPHPVSTWRTLLLADHHKTPPMPLQPLDNRRSLLTPRALHPGSSAHIVPLRTIDSSFALLVSRAPTSYTDPLLPALMVARAYLDAVEGPLWVAVRGTGLAYGTSFIRSTDTGLLMFKISRSPDVYKAFLAAREQVRGFATGKLPLEKFALEGAISEIVLGMADEQPTAASAAEYSFANQCIRGISKSWSHEMLAKVQKVLAEEVREVIRDWFLPVFEPPRSNLVVTCSELMKERLAEGFKSEGFDGLVVGTLEGFMDGYGLGDAGDGDGESGLGADEEEDEEDGDEDEDEDENEDDEEDEDDDNDD